MEAEEFVGQQNLKVEKDMQEESGKEMEENDFTNADENPTEEAEIPPNFSQPYPAFHGKEHPAGPHPMCCPDHYPYSYNEQYASELPAEYHQQYSEEYLDQYPREYTEEYLEENHEEDQEEKKPKGVVEVFNEYLESLFSTYEEQDEEIEEELSDIISLLWKMMSGTIGCVAIFFIITKYPVYLHTLHENQLWFSNIKEVEREISFRTEQGLYYSYYKKIIQSPSLSEGYDALTKDNTTEHGRTINIMHRFNILPEIILSSLYRWIAPNIQPIMFYVWSVFGLHGIFLAALYVTSWYLSGSVLSGAITILFYIIHRIDTTRVNYTIPLRESFAVPVLFLQILLICIYMNSGSWQKMKLTAIGLFTLAFLLSWQFGPFVLFCQMFCFLALCRLHLLSPQKVSKLVIMIGIAVVGASIIQDNPPILISSPVLSMVVPAHVLSTASLAKGRGWMVKVAIAAIELILLLVLTFIINTSIKGFLNIDADSHVYQLLLAKLQMGDPRDFDSRLYMCTDAFQYLDMDTLIRLSESGLLPLYAASLVLYGISSIYSLLEGKANAQKEEESLDCKETEEEESLDCKETEEEESLDCKGRKEEEILKSEAMKYPSTSEMNGKISNTENKRGKEEDQGKYCKSRNGEMIAERPDLIMFLGFSLLMAILALLFLRLKVLWLPMVCVLSGVVISDVRVYNSAFTRAGKISSYLPQWLPSYSKCGVCCILISFLFQKYHGQIRAELWPEEVYEFWDPDTVELMEWINSFTPPTAVFAGSMPLLAGVKLCTDRHITNHPHYEDGWLRERTHQVYQIYGKATPEEVHRLLSDMGTTHIILEDSICLLSPNPNNPLCRITDIIDLHNGHIPEDGKIDSADLEAPKHGRFCDRIRYGTPEYNRLFSLVMSNKTFRVYRVAIL